jgi:predicted nuclease of predicted toxin-antitoxin system
VNLLADEDIESAIVTRCREAGHIVLYVTEMGRGIDDPSVLQQANDSQSLLITGDKDFG